MKTKIEIKLSANSINEFPPFLSKSIIEKLPPDVSVHLIEDITIQTDTEKTALDNTGITAIHGTNEVVLLEDFVHVLFLRNGIKKMSFEHTTKRKREFDFTAEKNKTREVSTGDFG